VTGSRLYVFLIIRSAFLFIVFLHINPDILFWYALGRLHGLGKGSVFLASEIRYSNSNVHDTAKWILEGSVTCLCVPSAVACRSPELCCSCVSCVDCVWNVMAHAQKPDFVFRRNGRVHLNRRRASVQSTTGSRGVCISGSNAGYTVLRGSVKSTGYPLHSPVSPSLPLPCVTVCHHISTGLYVTFF
jgi:hypothetical protein